MQQVVCVMGVLAEAALHLVVLVLGWLAAEAWRQRRLRLDTTVEEPEPEQQEDEEFEFDYSYTYDYVYAYAHAHPAPSPSPAADRAAVLFTVASGATAPQQVQLGTDTPTQRTPACPPGRVGVVALPRRVHLARLCSDTTAAVRCRIKLAAAAVARRTWDWRVVECVCLLVL
mmetsp:Transcript_101756/g.232987  ORF Transcript_101756/g.232987 Transcript_101756/m.232987 type:complete len:172 (+) Transcript_101756:39-554(+)